MRLVIMKVAILTLTIAASLLMVGGCGSSGSQTMNEGKAAPPPAIEGQAPPATAPGKGSTNTGALAEPK